MKSSFLPSISDKDIENAQAKGDNALYDLFTEPLHKEIYARNTFDFLDELSGGQQLFVSYDYVRSQVGQGGFIQFIQNGYIGLVPTVIEQLYEIGINDMAKVLDDVLKVYVLNRDFLNRPTTVEEFAKLYEEFKEFEEIDERFTALNEQTIKLMLQYALTHKEEFATI